MEPNNLVVGVDRRYVLAQPLKAHRILLELRRIDYDPVGHLSAFLDLVCCNLRTRLLAGLEADTRCGYAVVADARKPSNILIYDSYSELVSKSKQPRHRSNKLFRSGRPRDIH